MAVLGAVGLACALAVGGLGYAATLAVSTSASPAAGLGPVPGTTLTSRGTTSASTSTTGATTTPTPGGAVSAPAQVGTAGRLALALGGGGRASIVWTERTFASDVTVSADPRPPTAVMSGLRNQLVGVNVFSAGGAPVTALGAPLDVVISGSRRGNVPVVSADGRHFRRLVRLRAPRLAGPQRDGYYLGSDGVIQILTRHLTIFGVLSPANRAKWGDVARARTKPPTLKMLAPAVSGQTVGFTLTVDEPVAMVLSAKAAGRGVPISGSSMVGTRQLGGPPAAAKQLNIVSGGRYAVKIVLARAWHGTLTISLVAGDNSGNRARKSLGFHAP